MDECKPNIQLPVSCASYETLQVQEEILSPTQTCGHSIQLSDVYNMVDELFALDPNHNLLPYDGETQYFGKVLSLAKSEEVFQNLSHSIPWTQDKVRLFGKEIITRRRVAWYGDRDFAYTYSGMTKTALPWIPELATLKTLVEEITCEHFHSCLLNYYHDGDDGMGWHSDDEKMIEQDSPIASVSLGAERKFLLRHKESREKVSLLLDPGSLLVMKGSTQRHWQHALPKSKRVSKPRINLTFRRIAQQ